MDSIAHFDGWKTAANSGVRSVSFGLESGQVLQKHYHHRAHLCFISEGEIEEYDGNTPIYCPSGTVRLSKPGVGHDVYSGSESVSGLMFELAPGKGFDDRRFWSDAPSNRYTHDPQLDEWIALTNASIENDVQRPNLEALSRMKQLLAWIAFDHRKKPAWYPDIEDYLDTHFLSSSLPKTLSKEAGLHRTHFARQFFKSFGMSVSEAVQIRRINYAISLLVDTNLSLSAIAFESAFSDQSHFTRCFKHYLNTTPGKYRQTYGSES